MNIARLAARILSSIGKEQHRRKVEDERALVKRVARDMRQSAGLPELPALRS